MATDPFRDFVEKWTVEPGDKVRNTLTGEVYAVTTDYQPAGVGHETISFYVPKEAVLSIAVADFRQVYPELVLEDETDRELADRIKKAAEFDRGYEALAKSRENLYPIHMEVPDDLSGADDYEEDN